MPMQYPGSLVGNLLVGLPVILLCLVIQVLFAYWCLRHYLRNSVPTAPPRSFPVMRNLLGVMLIVMLGTVVQVALWGLLFLVLGEFTEFYEAVYHSAVNFASLGYGDIVMSRRWKLLGPLEALCGVLMLGMNAAVLMAILQHILRSQHIKLELD
jgi:hypothetical protein